MSNESTGGFLQALEEITRQSRDIEELAALLRELPGVHSVEVRDYLVKTEPPIRELAIEYQTMRFIADITLHADGSLSIRGMHQW